MKGLLNKVFISNNKASLSKEVLLESRSKRLPENPFFPRHSSNLVCEIKKYLKWISQTLNIKAYFVMKIKNISQGAKNSLWNVCETIYKVKIMRYNKLVKKLTKDLILEGYGGKYGW